MAGRYIPHQGNYPSYYGYSQQQMPPQYDQYGQGGYGQPMGMGMNPQSLQQIMAWMLANQQEGGGQQQMPQEQMPPQNPYLTNFNAPTLTGLSPMGRFNDTVLRQSATLAKNLEDGKAAVAERSANQALVDRITHPAPTAPYSITSAADVGTGEQTFPNGAPLTLKSRYGTGGVTFAPPGTETHGRFGPDHLPFGQIGGANEAQPVSGDPMQTTYQQQMILDSIQKALGKKKKGVA